jgi:pilus assembly protein CpaE
MGMSRAEPTGSRTNVVVLTADTQFEEQVRQIFTSSPQIGLEVKTATVAAGGDAIDPARATVIVVDLNAGRADEMQALERLAMRTAGTPPIVVVTQAFDANVARTLIQLKVADFLVKPVTPAELVRSCARATQPAASSDTEAEIFTFVPAVGGSGVTTLAIQTAMLLLSSGGPRGRASACLVDLNLQHGCCADYLDLEPRLDLSEIEPRPDRLDRQLLEVMTTYHSSGLAVIAAPPRPAEMRSFDPDVVTKLLDLVSSHFDYVVIDMPRTWFAWTDDVLLGSNRVLIVSEMTVPSLKNTKHIISAIRTRMPDGPSPQVIINRFEQRMFAPGLKRSDILQALGDHFAGTIPNNYRLVREAIDRGVPLDEVKNGNNVTHELRKLIAPQPQKATGKAPTEQKKFSFSLAR